MGENYLNMLKGIWQVFSSTQLLVLVNHEYIKRLYNHVCFIITFLMNTLNFLHKTDYANSFTFAWVSSFHNVEYNH